MIDVSKTFGIESTLKDTTDDFFQLLDIISRSDLLLGILLRKRLLDLGNWFVNSLLKCLLFGLDKFKTSLVEFVDGVLLLCNGILNWVDHIVDLLFNSSSAKSLILLSVDGVFKRVVLVGRNSSEKSSDHKFALHVGKKGFQLIDY